MKRLVLVSLMSVGLVNFCHAQQGMGVGNNNPQEMLDVSGAIKIGGTLQGAADEGSIRWNGTIFEGFDGAAWIPLQGDDMGDHTATENIQLNDNWLSNDGDDEGITVDNDGNVGVGTDSPSEILNVNSSVSGEKIMGLFENFITGSSSGSTAGVKVVGRRGSTTNDYAFFDLENNSTGNKIRVGANSENGSKLRFYMHNGTSLIERLTLNSDGGLTINNEFTLPTTDGTNGQVLTTDGGGNVTWETSPTVGFTNMQGGLADVGSSGVDEVVTVTVTFPTAFSATPNVICTASAQPGTNFDDSFNVTTRNVSNTGFTMIVNRVDGSTWGQAVDVHWFAFQ